MRPALDQIPQKPRPSRMLNESKFSFLNANLIVRADCQLISRCGGDNVLVNGRVRVLRRCAMLRTITIVLATTAAFTGVLTVESFARGGGGGAQIGGGLGGHMSGGYGMGHFGGQPFGRGTEG
jgi:hypothetical protein